MVLPSAACSRRLHIDHQYSSMVEHCCYEYWLLSFIAHLVRFAHALFLRENRLTFTMAHILRGVHFLVDDLSIRSTITTTVRGWRFGSRSNSTARISLVGLRFIYNPGKYNVFGAAARLFGDSEAAGSPSERSPRGCGVRVDRIRLTPPVLTRA